MNEHVGTHMDAPYHFYSKGWTTDQIPLENLVNVPGVVVDISHKANTDVEAKLEEEDLEAWVAEHGDFPDRCLVLMRLANICNFDDSDSHPNYSQRSGWNQYYHADPAKFLGTDKADMSLLKFPGKEGPLPFGSD